MTPQTTCQSYLLQMESLTTNGPILHASSTETDEKNSAQPICRFSQKIMMKSSKLANAAVGWRMWLTLICLLLCQLVCQTSAGIPGGMQTTNGYDTEFGTDSICWLGRSAQTNFSQQFDSFVRTPWSNKLVEDFMLGGEVELFKECPQGTRIYSADVPEELMNKELRSSTTLTSGERNILRTGKVYNYTVNWQINLEHLNGEIITSNHGPVVGVQVVLCELGRVGFCSPFVHEQANARLEAANATVPVGLGERHGDTHVHSPTILVNVNATKKGLQSFQTIVPFQVNDPGQFFGVAAFQLFTSYNKTVGQLSTTAVIDASQKPIPHADFKYDVANALNTRLITYEAPPTILSVTYAAEVGMTLLIALASAAEVFFLVETIKHRNSKAIRLSQGHFLVLFLLAAIFANVASFMFTPQSDLYCQLVKPLVFVPLQLMHAILVGRLWRINAVISPLLMFSLQQRKSLTSRFFDFLSRCTASACMSCGKTSKKQCGVRSASDLRVTVTTGQLSRVVLLFTLPQVILQIVIHFLAPAATYVEFNEDESIGRYTCNYSAQGFMRWLPTTCLAILFVILLFVAHESRKLPSLFNETESIYNSTLTSTIFVILVTVMVEITNQPTVSPDVAYILRIAAVLVTTLNTTVRIMLPKLQMVWRGDNVMVSRLVTDQRLSLEKKNESNARITVHGSGRNEDGNPRSYGADAIERMKKESSVVARADVATSPCDNSSSTGQDENPTEEQDVERPLQSVHRRRRSTLLAFLHNKFRSGDVGHPEDEAGSTSSVTKEEQTSNKPIGDLRSTFAQTQPLSFRRPHNARRLSQYRRWSIPAQPVGGGGDAPSFTDGTEAVIRVGDNEAPSRRLLLRMVDAHAILGAVSQSVMTGMPVSHDQWELLRDSCLEMGDVFRAGVRFEWETINEEPAPDQQSEAVSHKTM